MKYIILMILSMPVFAHDHHGSRETLENSNGVALSIAMSQHHFDLSTEKLQGSVAMGTYRASDALSFSVGKRFGRYLINGLLGQKTAIRAQG